MLITTLIALTKISAFVLQALCLLFAVMGYRKSARKGYLLIAAFVAFFYFLVPYTQPLLRRMSEQRADRNFPEFAQKMKEDERIAAEIDKAILGVYEREGITVVPDHFGFVVRNDILFRIDLLLLAFGLWSLQSSERPKPKNNE